MNQWPGKKVRTDMKEETKSSAEFSCQVKKPTFQVWLADFVFAGFEFDFFTFTHVELLFWRVRNQVEFRFLYSHRWVGLQDTLNICNRYISICYVYYFGYFIDLWTYNIMQHSIMQQKLLIQNNCLIQWNNSSRNTPCWNKCKKQMH